MPFQGPALLGRKGEGRQTREVNLISTVNDVALAFLTDDAKNATW